MVIRISTFCYNDYEVLVQGQKKYERDILPEAVTSKNLMVGSIYPLMRGVDGDLIS